MSDAPQRMFVRQNPNGAMGRWHDATSLPETAAITSGGNNPMRAYILATPEALAASPEGQALIAAAVADATRIKPLVWEDADEGMCTKWRAPALGGRYELVLLDREDGLFSVNFCWGRPLSFWFIQGDPDEFGPTGPKKFPTLEAAMAAADADHAARVRAAIGGDNE